MNDPVTQIPFNEIEWENLVEHLRDCPGTICAVVVPGQPAGDALLALLPEAVKPIPFLVASGEMAPAEVGHLAITNGNEDRIVLIPLDGRRRFCSDDERQRYWEAMNFQRESLAYGKIRGCFILNEENDRWMMHCADDLREWVRIFRFPEAFEKQPESLFPEKMPIMMSEEERDRYPAGSLDVMRGQLARACDSGLPKERILREYAAPLFLALVANHIPLDAIQAWERFFRDESALELLERKQRFSILLARSRLANHLMDVTAWDFWSKRLLNENNNPETVEYALTRSERGHYLLNVNDLAGAKTAVEEALAAYRALWDPSGEANILCLLGILRMRMNDLEGAEKAFEESITIYRAIRDRSGEANCLRMQGLLELRRNRISEAIRRFLEALKNNREIHDQRGQCLDLMSLVFAARQSGAKDQAILLAEEALSLSRGGQDRFTQIVILNMQNQLWMELHEDSACLATTVLLQNLYSEMRREEALRNIHHLSLELKGRMPDETFASIVEKPEDARRQAVEQARRRFTDSGGSLFQLP